MFGKGKSEKGDKDSYRGDADIYDDEAKGPGQVDREGGIWDTYNWGGESTGSYFAHEHIGEVPFMKRW